MTHWIEYVFSRLLYQDLRPVKTLIASSVVVLEVVRVGREPHSLSNRTMDLQSVHVVLRRVPLEDRLAVDWLVISEHSKRAVLPS